MIDNHERLIEKGLEHHEAFRYSKALPFFRKAYKSHPNCPCAIYNLASTLHMLGHEKESKRLLNMLLKTPDLTLREGCPTAGKVPASFKLDAYFLLFHVVLSLNDSWAFPYAQEHLKCRRRGLDSVWSKRTVLKEIEDYRKDFERRSRQRRNRLSIARCIERRLPIVIDLYPTRDVMYSGVCIKQNRHVFILVNYNEKMRNFDGYTIFRNREVSRYRLWDADEIARANRGTLRAYLGVLPLEKMNTLHTCIREASRMGPIALFTGKDESSYYETYLTSMDCDTARFRLLRPHRQRPRHLKMQIADINYIAFDSSYERKLSKNTNNHGSLPSKKTTNLY
jgi:hypothetical protein